MELKKVKKLLCAYLKSILKYLYATDIWKNYRCSLALRSYTELVASLFNADIFNSFEYSSKPTFHLVFLLSLFFLMPDLLLLMYIVTNHWFIHFLEH